MLETLYEIIVDIVVGLLPLFAIGTVIGKAVSKAKNAAEEQKAKQAARPQPNMPNWRPVLPQESIFFPSQTQVSPVAQQPEQPAKVENLHEHVPIAEYATHEECEIDEELRLVSDAPNAEHVSDEFHLDAQRLRLAVIWSEVLDKPLAMRKPGIAGRRAS